MAIENLIIHVENVPRAVDFYTRYLSGRPVGEATDERAVLDFVTSTIEFLRLDGGDPPIWVEDDAYRGFRHIGFKVDFVDPYVEKLRADDVRFRMGPLDAVGEVRIVFFFDPDGTVLELVEGQLQYHEVHDAELVAAERALGVPDRPRFDHVGHTIDDLDAAIAYYEPYGFANAGTLLFDDDPRGFRIDYLRGGDTVIEVFTFGTGTHPHRPSLATYGFVAAELRGAPLGGSEIGTLPDGRVVVSDADDLPLVARR